MLDPSSAARERTAADSGPPQPSAPRLELVRPGVPLGDSPLGEERRPVTSGAMPPAVLADTLHLGGLTSQVCSVAELSAPWGLSLPTVADAALFHVVLQGRCVLDDGHGQSMRLRRGDVVVLPQGQAHHLMGDFGDRCVPLSTLPRQALGDRFERLQHGAGGSAAVVLMGALRLGDPLLRRLAATLPPLVALSALPQPDGPGPVAGHAGSSSAPPLAATDALAALFPWLAAEVAGRHAGTAAVASRLAELLVVQALRSWIERAPAAASGWLGALRDPSLGRALQLIHTQPGRPWTLALLATRAGLSRSAFAARFVQQVGVPPMAYLTDWRMCEAQARLAQPGSTVAGVAADLGYGSEAAFCRAFKRVVGRTPGRVPRQQPLPPGWPGAPVRSPEAATPMVSKPRLSDLPGI